MHAYLPEIFHSNAITIRLISFLVYKGSMVIAYRAKLTWTIALTAISTSISFLVLLGLILAASGLHWVVASLVLRGTIMSCWLLGLTMFGLGFFALNAKDENNRRNLVTALTVCAALFVIMTFAAGIDVTRILTSPTTILGKFGDMFAKILGNSRAAPKSVRGVYGETFLSTIGRVGTSIAVMQLITILPLPYNILLFFMYYRFMTGILFCLIPTIFAIWAFTQVYGLRSELQAQLKKQLEEEAIEYPSSLSEADDERRPLKIQTTSQVVVKEPIYYNSEYSRQPVLQAHPDTSKSMVYPQV